MQEITENQDTSIDRIVKLISEELGKKEEHVANVIKLMDEGNTIPFIARYRKEAHGAMDDTSLRKLEERLTYLRRLEERRAEILKAVEALGKLTLEHIAKFDAEREAAGIETEAVSPKLLPDYRRKQN